MKSNLLTYLWVAETFDPNELVDPNIFTPDLPYFQYFLNKDAYLHLLDAFLPDKILIYFTFFSFQKLVVAELICTEEHASNDSPLCGDRLGRKCMYI